MTTEDSSTLTLTISTYAEATVTRGPGGEPTPAEIAAAEAETKEQS